MKRILKIAMDVHSTNYTLCAMEPTIGSEDRIYGEIQVAPDYKEVLRFIDSLKMKLGLDNEYSVECGYEAGSLGYTLYHQLTEAGVKCVILAPTTMLTQQGKRVKTDRRDAHLIAQCLCYGGYHPVYIPTGVMDINIPEPNGPLSMSPGCISWNSLRCIGKRWMSTWRPTKNRKQRSSVTING